MAKHILEGDYGRYQLAKAIGQFQSSFTFDATSQGLPYWSKVVADMRTLANPPLDPHEVVVAFEYKHVDDAK